MGRAASPLARIHRAVALALERYREALTGRSLVVAVSGGPDSLALLLGTVAATSGRRDKVSVAHFSHGLRPEAEAEEWQLVRSVAERWGLPAVYGSGDVQALASETGQSLEAAARAARYQFLAAVATETSQADEPEPGRIARPIPLEPGVVLLGHTQDDQAETVLLRLVRGAGLRGARAMTEWSVRAAGPDRPAVVLLRPLLGVARSDTERACAEAGIGAALDASNLSDRFARNRLRHRVLPELRRINPRTTEALARFAAAAHVDDVLLNARALEAATDLEQRGEGSSMWPRTRLAELPDPLLRRVLQLAWRRLRGPGAALGWRHLETMAALVAVGSGGGSVALPGGGTFRVSTRSCELLAVASASSFLPETQLSVPGSVVVGGWGVTARLALRRPGSGTPHFAWFDAEALSGSVVIRGRRPGDRFAPAGIRGTRKLQDLLVEAGVPRWQRDSVPLLVSPRGIAWVVGQGVAAWAAPTADSNRLASVRFRWLDTI